MKIHANVSNAEKMMTPLEFRTIRLSLNLSCRRMALALGIEGLWGDRTIRRWQSGERKIPEGVVEKMKGLMK